MNATSTYDNIPPQDRCYLDGHRLLTRIIGDYSNYVGEQVEMAKHRLKGFRLLPTNTANDCCIDPLDESRDDAAKQIWKLLIDLSVPMGGYDLHGSTLLAHMVEHASPKFPCDLSNSADERFQQTKEQLKWLSVDKDGDTPRDIAKQRGDVSILGIVERGIQRQRETSSLEQFIAMKDSQIRVGIYFVWEASNAARSISTYSRTLIWHNVPNLDVILGLEDVKRH